MHVTQPAHQPVGEAPRALVARPQLFREGENGRQVGRDYRVGEVVHLRGRLARREGIHVGGGHAGGRIERELQLLDLALKLLLARADSLHEPLRRVGIHREPLLTRTVDHPLRQLPRLRRAVVADLPAGLLHRLAELRRRLTARNQDEHRVGRHSGERRLERRDLFRLPALDRLGQQVARSLGECHGGERHGHRLGPFRLPVEALEPAGPQLALRARADAGAPGVDLRVVIA